jgi:trehalose synthase-fused probable maltokinase
VPNKGDAWAFTLRELGAFYARAEGEEREAARMPALIGDYLDAARLLGKRTGELHLALAADVADPAFAPEPFSVTDQRELAEAIRASTQRVFELLRAGRHDASAHGALIGALLLTEGEIVTRTKHFETHPIRTEKTRTHGDYHLGQVLHTGADFVIIDFEGEPLRPLAWRKLKRSALRDVAGMLRSFHYAAHSALASYEGEGSGLEPWAENWSRFVGNAFLESWRQTTANAEFALQNAGEFERLLQMFLLEKVIYEVGYELNNRPAWLPIPVRGALALLGREPSTRG